MSQIDVECCCREAECVVRERPARRGGLDVSPDRELQTNGASFHHKHWLLHTRTATPGYKCLINCCSTVNYDNPSFYSYISCVILQISEVDFQDSVLVLGFSEELNKLLLQLYLENRKEIRQILSKLAPSLPHYHNLEWRLDVQVRLRFCSDTFQTQIWLKAKTWRTSVNTVT